MLKAVMIHDTVITTELSFTVSTEELIKAFEETAVTEEDNNDKDRN